jgi:hypothetical protein
VDSLFTQPLENGSGIGQVIQLYEHVHGKETGMISTADVLHGAEGQANFPAPYGAFLRQNIVPALASVLRSMGRFVCGLMMTWHISSWSHTKGLDLDKARRTSTAGRKTVSTTAAILIISSADDELHSRQTRTSAPRYAGGLCGLGRLLIASIRLADGHTVEREIEDHGEAVCVLPYNPVRRTAILVRQLRAPVLLAAGTQETLEAIAGVIENEDAAACMRREAKEEALLDLDSVEHV